MRVQLGLSKEELAKMCGITELNVTKIENGVYNYPIDLIGKIADALNAKIIIKSEPKESAVCKLVRWQRNKELVPLNEFMDTANVLKEDKYRIAYTRMGERDNEYAIVTEVAYIPVITSRERYWGIVEKYKY